MDINKDIRRALLFVIITYLFSWGIFIFAKANFLLMTLASCAPSITGLLLSIMSKSDAKRNFGKRTYSFKLIGLFWFGVIIFAIPLCYFLSAIILKFLNIETHKLGDIVQVVSNPALLFSFVIFSGLGAGVGEEFGWRGYLLDILQKQFNPLISSLIVGVFWAVWHIPLRILYKVDLLSFTYMADLLMIVSLSLFISWIYNNCHQSFLSAILTHGMFNAYLSVLSGGKTPSPYMSASIALCIVIFIAFVTTIYKPYSILKVNSKLKNVVPNIL